MFKAIFGNFSSGSMALIGLSKYGVKGEPKTHEMETFPHQRAQITLTLACDCMTAWLSGCMDHMKAIWSKVPSINLVFATVWMWTGPYRLKCWKRNSQLDGRIRKGHLGGHVHLEEVDGQGWAWDLWPVLGPCSLSASGPERQGQAATASSCYLESPTTTLSLPWGTVF